LLVFAISAVSAAAVIYWGGQDKQGQFRAEHLQANVGMLLFFIGPYVVLAVSAVVSWRHRPSSIACLWVTLLLAAVAVWAIWSDHDTSLRTPPGREVAPMLGFMATLLLWLGSVALLIAVWAKRMIRRGQPGAASRGTDCGRKHYVPGTNEAPTGEAHN